MQRRKRKAVESLEWWEKRSLARNDTLARKAKAKEHRAFLRAMEALDEAKAEALRFKEEELEAARERERERVAAKKLEAQRAKRVRVARGGDWPSVERALIRSGQAQHLAWARGLAPAARGAWGAPWFVLHVIADASRASTAPLERLLSSLGRADYLEDEVELRSTPT